MKILWLSHFIPYPPKGGALQRSYNLLREASRRHEVHLLALNQRASLPSQESQSHALRELSEFTVHSESFAIPADRSRLGWGCTAMAGFFRSSPYDINWLRSRALARRTREVVESGGIDVIHLDTIGLSQFVPGIPGLRVALTHHNIESQMMARRAGLESNPLKRVYLQRDAEKLAALEKRVCPNVAVNLVVSTLDAERLADIAPGSRSWVVENGVDVEYFRPRSAIEPKPGSLVFVGGMQHYANRSAVRFFLGEIWPLLIAEEGPHVATFVGANPPPELLRAASAGRLAAPGFVDDVRPYLAEAAIFVCPMLDGGGTRLKILDALAMGKPVVATALAVEGLALRREEHYLAAETPAEFVAQIRRLGGNAELGRRLGAQGRHRVAELYSWRAIGEKLDRAYRLVRSPGEGTRLSQRRADLPLAAGRDAPARGRSS